MDTRWSETHVSADTLRARIDDPDWVVVDCRFNLMQPDAGRAAYEAGHIPGAVYANLDSDLASPVATDGSGGRHPLPDPGEFGRLLASWGVGRDSVIVAYDDVGNAIAARLWWLARWVGHSAATVLDGGLDAWIAAGGSLATDVPTLSRGNFEPQPGAMPVVDVETVEARLANGSMVLLDARTADRFAGRSEPIDRIAGHIPGAINTPLPENLMADKCLRSAAELQAYYCAIIAERPIESVACMCGSGVTACHTLLALETAGLPGAALYVGSWSDWISSERRPIADE